MKKIILVVLLILSVTAFVSADSFFNLGRRYDTGTFFFGITYCSNSRDIILDGEGEEELSLDIVGFTGFVGINLKRELALYVKTGFNDNDVEDVIDAKFGARYGVGLRMRLMDFGEVWVDTEEEDLGEIDIRASVEGDLQLNYYTNDCRYKADDIEGKLSWIEYQGTVVATLMINSFDFYFGCKVSFLDGKLSPAFLGESGFREDGWFTALIGLAFDIGSNTRIGTEISFFAEPSFAFSLTLAP